MEFIASLVSFVLVLAVLGVIAVAVMLVASYNRLRRSRERILRMRADINAAVRHMESAGGKVNHILEGFRKHDAQIQLANSGPDAEITPGMHGAYVSYSRDSPQLEASRQTSTRDADVQFELEKEVLSRMDSYHQFVEKYNLYRTSFPAVLLADRLGFEKVTYTDESDSDSPGIFKTDTGALLRENLADVGLLVGEKTKQIAAGVSERSVEIAVYGKSKIEGALGRSGVKPEEGADSSGRDEQVPRETETDR